MTWLKNVKADIIEIFLKIVLILQINFGQPSRNSIRPNYPLNKVWRKLVINGSKSTDRSFIANSFCEYFSTVARNLYLEQTCSGEENLPNQVTESQFTFETAKESDILKELRNLKRKKASGLDNFPSGLLKDDTLVLTKPLKLIINLSLEAGVESG